jgi:sterol desaturase/sphingolipid hydroxylase (fatty acid hydroxylase superfamily)
METQQTITGLGLLEEGIREFILTNLLYFGFGGFAFLLFYFLMKEKWISKKIQKRFPTNPYLWFEIKYSILSTIIFGCTAAWIVWADNHGWTKMYNNISDYGIPYFIFSVIAMIFMHDTYFYWGHRFMHLKKIYPIVHQVHHHSINPSPWATFAFHPLEGIIEAAIVPIMVMIIPTHILAVAIFFVFMTFMNVLGHLGYEIYPAGFTKNKWFAWNNTSTHHNMHHSLFN